jgi:hypothetical protein
MSPKLRTPSFLYVLPKISGWCETDSQAGLLHPSVAGAVVDGRRAQHDDEHAGCDGWLSQQKMSVRRDKDTSSTQAVLVSERNSRHAQCHPRCDCMCTERQHCGTHAHSGDDHNKAGRFCTQSAAERTDEMFVRKGCSIRHVPSLTHMHVPSAVTTQLAVPTMRQ